MNPPIEDFNWNRIALDEDHSHCEKTTMNIVPVPPQTPICGQSAPLPGDHVLSSATTSPSLSLAFPRTLYGEGVEVCMSNNPKCNPSREESEHTAPFPHVVASQLPYNTNSEEEQDNFFSSRSRSHGVKWSGHVPQGMVYERTRKNGNEKDSLVVVVEQLDATPIPQSFGVQYEDGGGNKESHSPCAHRGCSIALNSPRGCTPSPRVRDGKRKKSASRSRKCMRNSPHVIESECIPFIPSSPLRRSHKNAKKKCKLCLKPLTIPSETAETPLYTVSSTTQMAPPARLSTSSPNSSVSSVYVCTTSEKRNILSLPCMAKTSSPSSPLILLKKEKSFKGNVSRDEPLLSSPSKPTAPKSNGMGGLIVNRETTLYRVQEVVSLCEDGKMIECPTEFTEDPPSSPLSMRGSTKSRKSSIVMRSSSSRLYSRDSCMESHEDKQASMDQLADRRGNGKEQRPATASTECFFFPSTAARNGGTSTTPSSTLLPHPKPFFLSWLADNNTVTPPEWENEGMSPLPGCIPSLCQYTNDTRSACEYPIPIGSRLAPPSPLELPPSFSAFSAVSNTQTHKKNVNKGHTGLTFVESNVASPLHGSHNPKKKEAQGEWTAESVVQFPPTPPITKGSHAKARPNHIVIPAQSEDQSLSEVANDVEVCSLETQPDNESEECITLSDREGVEWSDRPINVPRRLSCCAGASRRGTLSAPRTPGSALICVDSQPFGYVGVMADAPASPSSNFKSPLYVNTCNEGGKVTEINHLAESGFDGTSYNEENELINGDEKKEIEDGEWMDGITNGNKHHFIRRASTLHHSPHQDHDRRNHYRRIHHESTCPRFTSLVSGQGYENPDENPPISCTNPSRTPTPLSIKVEHHSCSPISPHIPTRLSSCSSSPLDGTRARRLYSLTSLNEMLTSSPESSPLMVRTPVQYHDKCVEHRSSLATKSPNSLSLKAQPEYLEQPSLREVPHNEKPEEEHLSQGIIASSCSGAVWTTTMTSSPNCSWAIKNRMSVNMRNESEPSNRHEEGNRTDLEVFTTNSDANGGCKGTVKDIVVETMPGPSLKSVSREASFLREKGEELVEFDALRGKTKRIGERDHSDTTSSTTNNSCRTSFCQHVHTSIPCSILPTPPLEVFRSVLPVHASLPGIHDEDAHNTNITVEPPNPSDSLLAFTNYSSVFGGAELGNSDARSFHAPEETECISQGHELALNEADERRGLRWKDVVLKDNVTGHPSKEIRTTTALFDKEEIHSGGNAVISGNNSHDGSNAADYDDALRQRHPQQTTHHTHSTFPSLFPESSMEQPTSGSDTEASACIASFTYVPVDRTEEGGGTGENEIHSIITRPVDTHRSLTRVVVPQSVRSSGNASPPQIALHPSFHPTSDHCQNSRYSLKPSSPLNRKKGEDERIGIGNESNPVESENDREESCPFLPTFSACEGVDWWMGEHTVSQITRLQYRSAGVDPQAIPCCRPAQQQPYLLARQNHTTSQDEHIRRTPLHHTTYYSNVNNAAHVPFEVLSTTPYPLPVSGVDIAENERGSHMDEGSDECRPIYGDSFFS